MKTQTNKELLSEEQLQHMAVMVMGREKYDEWVNVTAELKSYYMTGFCVEWLSVTRKAKALISRYKRLRRGTEWWKLR